MHITPDIAEAAYNLLLTTPPFRSWKLPPSDDIHFHIISHPGLRGDYALVKGFHRIRISYKCARHLSTLLATMAHEMIHLREAQLCARWDVEHSAVFHRMADQVCKYHGFDRGMF